MKYVICKTINKYLSSNRTSLTSFIKKDDVNYFFTLLVLVLQHVGKVTVTGFKD